MARDRKIGRHFWLHEFPGWELATDADVAHLERTVAMVLDPVRDAFGPVYPSSWTTWSDGTPRSGAHSHPGTVDFVVAGDRTRAAWEWGADYLVPLGYVGRWIYEPERDPDAGVPQGEHIHMAPQEAMVAVFDDPRVQVLEETSEGHYELVQRVAGGALLAFAAAAAVFFSRAGEGAMRNMKAPPTAEAIGGTVA